MGILKKVTKPFKKVVRKIVPKELSGIMRFAAPFVAPYSLPGAAALSIGGQLRSGRGRISPLETVLALAPSDMARGLTKRVPGGEALDRFLYGTPEITARKPLAIPGEDVVPTRFLPGLGEERVVSKATQGILGVGGKFGPKEFLQGSLIRKSDGTLNKKNIAALAASGVSLASATKEIEQEAVEAGVSDSDIDALTAEAADFWSTLSSDDFKVTPTLAKGGRVGFAEGTDKNIPDNPKSRDMASFAKLKDFVNPSNYFMNPKETDDFQTMQKERFMYDYEPKMPEKMLDKIRKLLDKDDRQASADSMNILNDMAIQLFGKPLDELNDREKDAIMSFMKPSAKKGGLMRTNYALGTRPTAQESGLGGLPIEADMRYSGGFMPYGAKEKADDVPARLSKNEFVFTADAVRAAGGGSVQKGAQRMYNTMKQLEAMGKA